MTTLQQSGLMVIPSLDMKPYADFLNRCRVLKIHSLNISQHPQELPETVLPY